MRPAICWHFVGTRRVQDFRVLECKCCAHPTPACRLLVPMVMLSAPSKRACTHVRTHTYARAHTHTHTHTHKHTHTEAPTFLLMLESWLRILRPRARLS